MSFCLSVCSWGDRSDSNATTEKPREGKLLTDPASAKTSWMDKQTNTIKHINFIDAKVIISSYGTVKGV